MEEEKTILVQIPEEIENLKLPNPNLIEYYKNYNDRYIFVDTSIDEALLDASRQIMRYNIQDKNIEIDKRKRIFVYIYSYGGDLNVAYSFIAMCEMSKTPIVTINMGIAYSSGLLILLAGKERYCFRRSQAMIHTGSSGMSGSYEQMRENQKSYDKMIEQMGEYILQKTNINKKTFNKNKDKDWYLTDVEQVNYGIVDRIVDNIDEIL